MLTDEQIHTHALKVFNHSCEYFSEKGLEPRDGIVVMTAALLILSESIKQVEKEAQANGESIL